MSREELMKLTPEEMKARLDQLNANMAASKDEAEVKAIHEEIKEVLLAIEFKADNERIALLKLERDQIKEKPEKDITDAERVRLREIKKELDKIFKKRKEDTKTKQEKGKTKTNSDKEKPSDKSKGEQNKGKGKEKSGQQNPKSEKTNEKSNKKEKTMVETEEIAKLKEELKECAEKRRIFKKEARDELEAIEASKYNKLVERINQLQNSQNQQSEQNGQKPQSMSLKKVNEELIKLREELKRCGERRREYKGFDAQVAIEAAKYSELVEKIHNLEQQKLEIENKLAKLREELKECGERRKAYKGFDAQVAMEAANYSRIVEQIRELENGKEEVLNPKPSQSKTDKQGEGKSGEGKSGEGKSEEGKSGEGKSEEGKSGEGKSGEGKSEEGKSGEGKSEEYGSKLPIKTKQSCLKKMAKGFFSAMGRKIAQIFKAIKNGPIGKPFKWLYSRIHMKGELPEKPWRERFLRVMGLSIEALKEDENVVTVGEKENEENSDKYKEYEFKEDNAKKEKKHRRGELGKDGIHETVSSILDAMKSAKTNEDDEYEESTDKPEQEGSKSDEGSEVEGPDKASETSINYGGYEFSNRDKAIIERIMNGKKLINSQIVTTTDGIEKWINPDGTLTDQPKERYSGPKTVEKQKTINATVDENGRVVEDDEREV